jgi:hypothetical protein
MAGVISSVGTRLRLLAAGFFVQRSPVIRAIDVAKLNGLFGALARAFTSAAEAAQAAPGISRRLFPVADAKVGEILTRIKRELSQ